ncbi:DUF6046 domain-containing protein [Flagellimonas onchidii]|uniref:DUF6046 domain-containing protein n=1 Tax=Flagellimonas onchidii TaxID=2562684 RepID=UPI0010A64334|nr:DUF6046 domain-containing protein [Allomuricauda onchidii]
MTQVTIDLGKRYAAAFGLLAVNNSPSRVNLSREQSNFKLESFEGINDEFENIQFIYEGTEINFAALPFTKDADKTIGNVLAPPPLISFSRQKQHIETPVNDSDNIVVERWGIRPWEMRVRGLLIDVEKRHYPESRVKQLYKLFEYNGVVEASGTQFFDKDIASVYFKNIEINGVQGFQDTIQFSLQMMSIGPVGFSLLNP